nr:EOG090X0GY7 [Triops cancriformis]
MGAEPICPDRHRYPCCIVWSPIPLLTWLCPLIGHMGIASSVGVVRDFAGPFFVSEDKMGFGWPTKYYQLDATKIPGGSVAFDRAIADASDEYKSHNHNLCCDNCHSHVALALNNMSYPGSRQWNMINVWWEFSRRSSYISSKAWLKTWLPFLIIAASLLALVISYLS